MCWREQRLYKGFCEIKPWMNKSLCVIGCNFHFADFIALFSKFAFMTQFATTPPRELANFSWKLIYCVNIPDIDLTL